MDEEFDDEKRNDPRLTADLIHLALTETDEDAAWEPVTVLQCRATHEVLDTAEQLCASSVAKEREVGANILGQLGSPKRTFPDECFQVLSRMLLTEEDPGTLNAIAVAFGHLHDPRCIDLLIPLKTHPNEDVRYGVVHGLGWHNHPATIEAMIELSRDVDDDVRDWATFYLGGLNDSGTPEITFIDTPEIREVLWARVSDSYVDARMEAFVGLAYRKDSRIVKPLLEELAADNVDEMAIEAAGELGDSRLLPALLKLKDWWPGDSKWDAELLDKAIASCRGNSEQH
jgi:HEAT repeat protein